MDNAGLETGFPVRKSRYLVVPGTLKSALAREMLKRGILVEYSRVILEDLHADVDRSTCRRVHIGFCVAAQVLLLFDEGDALLLIVKTNRSIGSRHSSANDCNVDVA